MWYDFDKLQVPNEVDAVEIKETLTLEEIQKYPDLYEQIKDTIKE